MRDTVTIGRREWLGLLAALPGLAAGKTVRIWADSGIPAYAEALEGIRARLAAEGHGVTLEDRTQRAAPGSGSRVGIAVGREAMEKADTPPDVSVLITMALRQDVLGLARKPAGAVLLDMPPQPLLTGLSKLMRPKSRFGVILNPQRTSGVEAGLAAMAKQGSVPICVAECTGPERLLGAFLSLRGKADVVVTGPDGSLYSSATIKPLILASLENRLPLVGFSAAFVRAGAAFGVYPDFRDVGAQTAELALQMLAARKGQEEYPRKLVVAMNQKVCRLLGLNPEADPGAVVVFK
ncbi:MAG: hypothetical protein HY820_27255 [Acidobacteria bacterium]|nr:hypothetical protein [Acidobacteriota bacterium]